MPAIFRPINPRREYFLNSFSTVALIGNTIAVVTIDEIATRSNMNEPIASPALATELAFDEILSISIIAGNIPAASVVNRLDL
jgi:hypothetical protein